MDIKQETILCGVVTSARLLQPRVRAARASSARGVRCVHLTAPVDVLVEFTLHVKHQCSRCALSRERTAVITRGSLLRASLPSFLERPVLFLVALSLSLSRAPLIWRRFLCSMRLSLSLSEFLFLRLILEVQHFCSKLHFCRNLLYFKFIFSMIDESN